MDNIVLVGYRDWAINIIESFDVTIKILSKEEWDRHHFIFDKFYIFIGWSWIIDNDFVAHGNCLCIHPSNLPSYRGGSPIQNQVIDGLESTSVTLFKMNNKLDAGPIFDKVQISLKGYLNDIFSEIEKASVILIKRLITSLENNNLNFYDQDDELSSYCKRRKPEDSIITLSDIENMTAKQVYNIVRCLQNPYPPMIIKLKDNSKVILKQVDYEN